MGQEIFKINGVYPDVDITSLQRNASILDGPAAGRLKNGNMVRDIVGTFYNYSIEADSIFGNLASYDALYETITAPVESYPVEVPFGQGLLMYDAYVANANDELSRITDSANLWKGLSFAMIAMKPARYYGEAWSLGTGSGNQVFSIDNVGFNVEVSKLSRIGAVLDSSKSGRSKSGVMNREIIGTYYNFSMDIDPALVGAEEYDRFYYALTAPVDSHKIVAPYGQSMLTFQAYVTSVSDKLILSKDVNYWSGLKVNFVAMEPIRR